MQLRSLAGKRIFLTAIAISSFSSGADIWQWQFRGVFGGRETRAQPADASGGNKVN
jgi:hypothetical protein